MDDLIVIILTMIIAGAGALGQLRKKKQAPTQNEEQREPDSFWDMLQDEPRKEEIIEDVEQEVRLDEPKPYYRIADIDNSFKAKPIYDFKASSEGQDAIAEDRVMKKEKTVLRSKIRSEFSLKKAVIYSEILNRKYN